MVCRILVAEDSFALANLLSFVLKNAGFDVDLHRNGQSAWEASQNHKYDLILLDQQMPFKSGLEVIEALRQHGPNGQTPVFLCTAKSHELGLDEVRTRLAICGVFHKPFSPKELVAQLQAFTLPALAE
jgi:two-component system, chemotaxis family, chemotaxis protein CheY